MWPWKPKPLKVETEYGEFTRATPKGEWLGIIASRSFKAVVHASDVNHQPNPELLSQLSRIRRDWETLRATVQEAVPSLAARHSEIHIYDDGPESNSDFSLEFLNPQDENDEITVSIKRGRVIETFVGLDEDDEE